MILVRKSMKTRKYFRSLVENTVYCRLLSHYTIRGIRDSFQFRMRMPFRLLHKWASFWYSIRHNYRQVMLCDHRRLWILQCCSPLCMRHPWLLVWNGQCLCCNAKERSDWVNLWKFHLTFMSIDAVKLTHRHL